MAEKTLSFKYVCHGFIVVPHSHECFCDTALIHTQLVVACAELSTMLQSLSVAIESTLEVLALDLCIAQVGMGFSDAMSWRIGALVDFQALLSVLGRLLELSVHIAEL